MTEILSAQRHLRLTVTLGGVLLGLWGCDFASNPGSPEEYCQTLEFLHAGEVDVDAENRNEMVSQVKALEALMAFAIPAVREDLAFIRDKLARVRDAGGWGTLLDFAALQDPQLAAAEGRVTQYTADVCGIQYGEVDWSVDESEWDATPCSAWPRAGSPLMNNRFPYLIATAGANYFSAIFWSVPIIPAPPGMLSVPRGGSVVFEGEYPFTRYFAFHPNDYETNNLETLADASLDPDPGSANPWREPVREGVGRRYTARLVFGPKPEEPESNTSYVGQTPDGRFNPAVFLIYRIYAADQGALPPNSAGVKLPAVTIYDEDGNAVEHHDACEPYPPGYEPPVDKTSFPAFPVPSTKAVFRGGELSTTRTWGIPVDILGNKDVMYISLSHSKARGEIMAVRAKAFRTPSQRHGVPLWSPDIDIRLWTVCNYNFWNGRATACVVDENIPLDSEGAYTLVASSETDRPTNATLQKGFTWLDTGPYPDGRLSFRMLMAEDRLLRGLKAAIDSGEATPEIAPYVPEIAFCSRVTFEGAGWSGCKAEMENSE